MTLSLSELQDKFSSALRYQANGEECGIVPDHFSADARMQIYRNNFVMSLEEVLAASYPITLALVGEECFHGLARNHIIKYPPQDADIGLYGANFCHSISSASQVISAAPYLAEVARLEWAKDFAQQCHSNDRFERSVIPFSQLETLSSSQQQQIILCPNSSLQLISSDFAVFSITQAVITEEFDSLNINMPEQGVVVVNPAGESVSYTLVEGEYQLLEGLLNDMSLQELSPGLLGHLDALLKLDLFIGFTINT